MRPIIDIDEADGALHAFYAALYDEGNTRAEIDAIFENKLGITDATETYSDD